VSDVSADISWPQNARRNVSGDLAEMQDVVGWPDCTFLQSMLPFELIDLALVPQLASSNWTGPGLVVLARLRLCCLGWSQFDMVGGAPGKQVSCFKILLLPHQLCCRWTTLSDVTMTMYPCSCCLWLGPTLARSVSFRWQSSSTEQGSCLQAQTCCSSLLWC